MVSCHQKIGVKMIWSKQRFQHSFELLPRVLKEVAPLLIPLSLIVWGLDFYMSYLNKARFDDPYNSSMATIILVGLGGVILQTLGTVVWLLFVARSTQRQMKNGTGEKACTFLKKNFHQALIEYIRGMISTGLYSLLLIIPGLIRWTQLIFVCLVSAFDPKYQEGKKDALKESSRLVRGHFVALSFLLSLQMTVPFLIEDFAKSPELSYGVTGVLFAFSWIFTLYFAIYFSLTFFGLASLKMEKA